MSNFIDNDNVVIYTKEQVIKVFQNYNYDIAAIDKNFYKNYVDSMYIGFFNTSPPKSYTKKKILETLCSSCQNLAKYEKQKNTIIDITK